MGIVDSPAGTCRGRLTGSDESHHGESCMPDPDWDTNVFPERTDREDLSLFFCPVLPGIGQQPLEYSPVFYTTN